MEKLLIPHSDLEVLAVVASMCGLSVMALYSAIGFALDNLFIVCAALLLIVAFSYILCRFMFDKTFYGGFIYGNVRKLDNVDYTSYNKAALSIDTKDSEVVEARTFLKSLCNLDELPTIQRAMVISSTNCKAIIATPTGKFAISTNEKLTTNTRLFMFEDKGYNIFLSIPSLFLMHWDTNTFLQKIRGV